MALGLLINTAEHLENAAQENTISCAEHTTEECQPSPVALVIGCSPDSPYERHLSRMLPSFILARPVPVSQVPPSEDNNDPFEMMWKLVSGQRETGRDAGDAEDSGGEMKMYSFKPGQIKVEQGTLAGKKRARRGAGGKKDVLATLRECHVEQASGVGSGASS